MPIEGLACERGQRKIRIGLHVQAMARLDRHGLIGGVGHGDYEHPDRLSHAIPPARASAIPDGTLATNRSPCGTMSFKTPVWVIARLSVECVREWSDDCLVGQEVLSRIMDSIASFETRDQIEQNYVR